MSPIVTAKGEGSASGDYRKESTLARLLGSGMNWLSRMNNRGKANVVQDLPELLSSLSSILYAKNNLPL